MISCSFEKADLSGWAEANIAWLTDEDRGIRVGILPEDGGGLTSFQLRRDGRYHELLYRAMDYGSKPPDGWDGRAPLLWPAVGRNYTAEQIRLFREKHIFPKEFFFECEGKAYPMPMHGFARILPWAMQDYGHGDDGVWVTCRLESSRRTKIYYPFKFAASVKYILRKGELVMQHEILAGANEKAMPFSIGNHVSFVMPLTRRGSFGDCTIRTPGGAVMKMNLLSAPSGKNENIDLSRPTSINRPELLDNLLGGYPAGENWLELVDPRGMRIHIHHEEKTPGKRYSSQKDMLFVFWGSAELGYYCPEPWIGLPNSLNSGKGVMLLPPGEKFVWEVAFRPEIF